MKDRLSIIIFCFVNLCMISFNSGAQENYEIRRINFHGNKTLDDDFLLENMALKGVSYVKKILTKNEPFLYNEEMIRLDLERLTRIYQREGFLFVDVSSGPLTVNNKRKTVKLNFNIKEGDPVLVDTATIKILNESPGINTDSLINKVTNKLDLIKGKRFREASLEEDTRILEKSLTDLGYAYTKITYELDLDIEDHKTAIHYSAQPGPKSYFGETTISGNKKVSEQFISKQLKYDKGDLYSRSLLNKTRENLYRLHLFRVVSISPQKNSKTAKNMIPVNIYTEEAPRLNTRFGAGYGTEDKFRTFLDINYLGFLGTARRVNLFFKHSALEPYSFHIRWIQPQFMGLNSSVSLNPFLMSKSEPGYTVRTFGINIPFTYYINRWLTSKVTYYFEDVEQTVEPGDEDFPDIDTEKFPYNKSGFLLSTVFDNSNPEFSPERGFNVSLGLKLNGYLFGGNYNYTRLWGDFRIYHEIKNIVLAFRVMGGGICSADTSNFIPVEDRFYSGGSNSIRGWSRSALGPMRNNGKPLGGKSIFECNMEVRYHIFWRLSVVAFIEAGNVWKKSYSFNLNDLGYAAGSGIRIETPIGPVRFDAGFPVRSEKKSPQFFISVGQAF